MQFLRNMLKWGVARWSDAAGSGLVRPNGVATAIVQVYSFDDFKPSILASFVANTTASQSGTTVTVSATGHGIAPAGALTSKNGYRIYYPGSSSIPAGWYSGFAYIDANTVTFQRVTPASVASESVNGGSAYTALTTFASFALPGGALGSSGHLSTMTFRAGDSTAGVKSIRLYLDGLNLCTAAATSAPITPSELGFYCVDTNKQVGAGAPNGTLGVTQYVSAFDMSLPRTVSMAISVSGAAQWLSVDYLDIRVIKK